MDYRPFLKMLINELQGDSQTEVRHILRFRRRSAFRRCFNLFKELRGSIASASAIQPLGMIQAFSCSLRSGTKLQSFPFIESIEIDTKMNIHALPVFGPVRTLPRLSAKSVNVPWGVRRIKAPQAWSHSLGDEIGVGVIDTGVDFAHPDLRGAIGKGINMIHRNLPPIDDNGHGTHIAGTIAAASSSGIIGVAPKAIIHPVKAFDRNGSAYVSDIIYGMDWCVQNRIPIINMSFGMKRYSKALEDAVRNAYRAGIVIVASSGNDSRRSQVDYPAHFAQSISVGATNEHKKIAPFSNRGRRIDIYAPGSRIFSTWLHGKYNELSGTSMATSHVSGVIALMLAKRPHLTPEQIKSILRRQSTVLTQAKKIGYTIKEVNARRAVGSVVK